MIISAICVLAVVDIAFYTAVCAARESAREERITRDKWARHRRSEALRKAVR
jgi:hypothetical protein